MRPRVRRKTASRPGQDVKLSTHRPRVRRKTASRPGQDVKLSTQDGNEKVRKFKTKRKEERMQELHFEKSEVYRS